MNRFDDKRSRTGLPGFLISVLIFCAVLFLAARGITSVSDTARAKERESLEQAVRRNIIHCYATEGFYPPDLLYLKEHYGLTYDESAFWIDYQPIGSNLMPDVTILETGGSS
ncbi:hypothetical protein [Qiania dongpingensis]|uniref:Uncharacterized protein n=1 Tax=Qiania dongpingensis TaxID=2763669 RepID=A0A7G9G603_9FIRM|nr:hypothetical protein [Qiania dongpingensis]QNM06235.1 hypothetical protein H9Q78_03525 [Qiania dongpingensis]